MVLYKASMVKVLPIKNSSKVYNQSRPIELVGGGSEFVFIYLFRHTTTSTLCSVAIPIEVMMTTIIERYYGWETGRI